MRTLLLALALASACKKADDGKQADQAAQPRTAEGATAKSEPPKVEPAKTEPAKPAPAAAPINVAKLATGEPRQGCFAWSASNRAAACVVGFQGTQDRELFLAYVGTDVRSPLADLVADGTARTENEVLAREGYVAFADKPVDVPPNAKIDAGGSLSLSWSITQTTKGGNNVAPSRKGKVTATCNGKSSVIYEQDEEEGKTFSVTLRTLTSHALVEIKSELGREGEYGHGTHAILIDHATCAVSTTN
ncbi:MAG: hypothetical protein JNL83_38730 [Myxococcales bacterium]|nr:hypothetical protein [Myxococcales bacterium]